MYKFFSLLFCAEIKSLHNSFKIKFQSKFSSFRFFLFFRLFIVMGASWIMEIVSWCLHDHVPTYISYPTDIINSSQGFFIFVFLVCKKSVWRLMQKRYFKHLLLIKSSLWKYFNFRGNNPQCTPSFQRSTISSETKISMTRVGSVRYTRNNSNLSSI